MQQIFDVKYAAPEKCLLDIYTPENVQKPPVYVYFHGGGIVEGSRKIGNKTPEFYCNNGIAFVSVEYRMYPDAKFPEYIIDCANAVKFIMDNYDFGKVIIGGSSAGGYLSMMLYFNKEYLNDVDTSRIAGYIFNAGQPTSHFSYLKFDKKVDSRCVLIDEGAPIYYLRENFSEEEPYLFFICAERDMTNRVNQHHVLLTAMKQFKFPEDKLLFKIYENETHCSYDYKDYYLNDCLDFIQKSLGE